MRERMLEFVTSMKISVLSSVLTMDTLWLSWTISELRGWISFSRKRREVSWKKSSKEVAGDWSWPGFGGMGAEEQSTTSTTTTIDSSISRLSTWRDGKKGLRGESICIWIALSRILVFILLFQDFFKLIFI